MREKVLTEPVRQKVISLRREGYSYSYIAHLTGLLDGQVYLLLSEAGLIGKVSTIYRKPYGAEYECR